MASRNGSAAGTISISHSVSTSMELDVEMNQQHYASARQIVLLAHLQSNTPASANLQPDAATTST
jgi:hypothetical protein